jgi:hypothetical protein
VDGTFAVPGASGCGGIFSENVDSILGIPAGAEENGATLEGFLRIANDGPVRAP